MNHSPLHCGNYARCVPSQEEDGQNKTLNMSRVERERLMVTCRETVGDCDRSLKQTLYFSEDRWCSRLPTDTTVKSETERSDPESVSITKRAPLSFQSVRPTGPSSPSSTATRSKFCTTTPNVSA